jgi:hypothetical protein
MTRQHVLEKAAVGGLVHLRSVGGSKSRFSTDVFRIAIGTSVAGAICSRGAVSVVFARVVVVVMVVTGDPTRRRRSQQEAGKPKAQGEKRKDDRKGRYISNITQHVKRRKR